MKITNYFSIKTTVLTLLIITFLFFTDVYAEEYCKVQRLAEAFLEPVRMEDCSAGSFLISSVVRIDDTIEAADGEIWVEITYSYSPELEIQYFQERDIEDCDPEGERSLYVLKKDTIPLPEGHGYSIEPNVLISVADIAVTGIPEQKEFDDSLIMTMDHHPELVKKSSYSAAVTCRTKTLGDKIDFADTLTVQGHKPYHGRTKFIFTPAISIDGQIAYALDGRAEFFIANDANIKYTVPTDYQTNQQVRNGLEFILKNAPPYSVYCCFPADFEEASRTAAALAIRAFMKDYAGTEDWIDIYNNVLAYDTDAFGPEYIGYMYWLYNGAVEAYANTVPEKENYISIDAAEPVLNDNEYTVEMMVITDAEEGWKLEKGMLPEGVIVTGATETIDQYTGTPGVTNITLHAGLEYAGNTISLGFQYNRGEPELVFLVPEDENASSLVMLTTGSVMAAAKEQEIYFKPDGDLIVTILDSASGKPIPDVEICLKKGDLAKRITTDRNGTAKYIGISGSFSLNIEDIPDAFHYTGKAEQIVTIASGQKTEYQIGLEPLRTTVTIIVDDLYSGERLSGCDIRIVDQQTGEEQIRLTDTDGKAIFSGLAYGAYTIQQTTGNNGYMLPELPENLFVNEFGKTYEKVIHNTPVNGVIRIAATTEDNIPIKGAEFIVFKDKKEIGRMFSDDNGIAAIGNIETGTYNVTSGSIPPGYKSANYNKKIYLRKNKTSELSCVYERYGVPVIICPREQKEYDVFKPSKVSPPRAITGNCELEGLKYSIIAAESVMDYEGNEIYAPGNIVEDELTVEGKTCAAETVIRFPGKYVIHEISNTNGYEPADDICLTIKQSDEQIAIPVLKKTIKKSIAIEKTNNNGEPEPDKQFYLYTINSKSFSRAPENERWILTTDSNGYAIAENVPYGEYILLQLSKRGGDLLRDKIVVSVDDDHGELQTYYIRGNDAGRMIRLSNSDLITGDTIREKSEYVILSEAGDILYDSFTSYGNQFIPYSLHDGKYILRQISCPEGYTPADEFAFTVGSDFEKIAIINSRKAYSVQVNVWEPGRNRLVPDEDESGLKTTKLVYNYLPSQNIDIDILDEQDNLCAELENGEQSRDNLKGRYKICLQNIPAGLKVEDEATLLINTLETDRNPVTVDIYLAYKETEIQIANTSIPQTGQNGLCCALFAEDGEFIAETEKTLRGPLKAETAVYNNVTIREALPAGNYYLTFFDLNTEIQNPEKLSFAITIPGQIIQLDLINITGYPVELSTEDSISGKKLANVYLKIGDDEFAYTGTDGIYRTRLQPGRYAVETVLVPECYSVPLTTYELVIENDGTVNNPVIQIPPHTISLVETDTYGKPVCGATLELRSAFSKMTAKTDEHGIAIFTNVGFGEYNLHELYPAPGYLPNSTQITIQVDGSCKEQKTPVATLISRINTIYCELLNDKGLPVQGAEIKVKNGNGDTFQSMYTDPDGKVILYGIPYGSYTLETGTIPKNYLAPVEKYPVVISSEYMPNENEPFRFICRERKLEYRLITFDGTEVPGIEFEMIDKSTAETIQISVSDSEGYILFDKFDYGEYLIREKGDIKGYARTKDMDVTIDSKWNSPDTLMLIAVPDVYCFMSRDNHGQILREAIFLSTNKDTGEEKIYKPGQNGMVEITGLDLGSYEILEYYVPAEYEKSEEKICLSISEEYVPPESPYIFITKQKVQ